MKGKGIMLTKRLLLIVCSVFLLANFSIAQDYEYIGAKKCKMCHNKAEKGEQYNKWMEGPHANAMKSLEGDDAKNPDCLKCHATVYAVNEDLLTEDITDAEGVSCESCHGPGSVYKSMSIMKSQEKSLANGLILPTEEVCVTCHNENSPTFKGFNYEEYVAKIAHPNPLEEEE
jgi:Cytochrome c554 and c-prime